MQNLDSNLNDKSTGKPEFLAYKFEQVIAHKDGEMYPENPCTKLCLVLSANVSRNFYINRILF